MWWFITILIFIYSLFISYLLILSLRRINNFENVILNIQNIIDYSSRRLKVIDDKGTFESDDEVGFMFEELKRIQEVLDNLFENRIEENVDAEKEK
tara:strand:+ start:3484 stop:3771 length:288 start_codon:yes stop_codon:yes gene_type:complete